MNPRVRRQGGFVLTELLLVLGLCLGLVLALLPCLSRWQELANGFRLQLGARAAGSTFTAHQQRAQYLHSNHVRFSMNPKGSQVYGHYGTRQRTVLDYPSLGLGDFRVRTFEGGFTPTGNGEEGFAVAVCQQADPDRYQLLSFSHFVGRMEYHGFR